MNKHKSFLCMAAVALILQDYLAFPVPPSPSSPWSNLNFCSLLLPVMFVHIAASQRSGVNVTSLDFLPGKLVICINPSSFAQHGTALNS